MRFGNSKNAVIYYKKSHKIDSICMCTFSGLGKIFHVSGTNLKVVNKL